MTDRSLQFIDHYDRVTNSWWKVMLIWLVIDYVLDQLWLVTIVDWMFRNYVIGCEYQLIVARSIDGLEEMVGLRL